MFVSIYPELQGVLASRGISIPDYARFLGISKKAMYQKMSGKVSFSLNEYASTCELLECSLADGIRYFFSNKVS